MSCLELAYFLFKIKISAGLRVQIHLEESGSGISKDPDPNFEIFYAVKNLGTVLSREKKTRVLVDI